MRTHSQSMVNPNPARSTAVSPMTAAAEVEKEVMRRQAPEELCIPASMLARTSYRIRAGVAWPDHQGSAIRSRGSEPQIGNLLCHRAESRLGVLD